MSFRYLNKGVPLDLIVLRLSAVWCVMAQQDSQEMCCYTPDSNEAYLTTTKVDQDRFSHSEQREVLRRNGERAGWDDPEMDAYDDYDAHHPTAS